MPRGRLERESKQGYPRHWNADVAKRRLTKSQVKRIKAIETVLADVYPDGLDEVIATDRNPEAAIADWERLAAAYEEQAQGRPLEERRTCSRSC